MGAIYIIESRDLNAKCYIKRTIAEKNNITFDGFAKLEMIKSYLKEYEGIQKAADIKNTILILV